MVILGNLCGGMSNAVGRCQKCGARVTSSAGCTEQKTHAQDEPAFPLRPPTREEYAALEKRMDDLRLWVEMRGMPMEKRLDALEGKVEEMNPTMAETKLKPCPHCGGEAILISREGLGIAFVQCKKCCASTQDMKTEHGAIRRWNRREGGE